MEHFINITTWFWFFLNSSMILMKYSIFIDEIKIHLCFCPFHHSNFIFLMFQVPGTFATVVKDGKPYRKRWSDARGLSYWRLAEVPGVARKNLIQSWYMREKRVLNSTTCRKSWPVVSSPLGSPAAKAILRQLRKKCASIEIRYNDKYYWFELSFTVPIHRENPDHKLCSVLLESCWILISFEDRETDKCLCDSDFSNTFRRLFLWTKGWPTAFWTWQTV